jgi:chemotaxis protein MotC
MKVPRAWRAGAAMLPLLAGLAAPALADEGAGLAPYQMVRSLQMVQDRIAAGDHAALPMQRKLLEMIDARLTAAAPDEFADQRNFRSLLIYGMSGGNPVTLDHVLAKLTLDEGQTRLASGVLNYVNGRPKAAKAALAPVEPLKANNEIAAFIALVKGSIAANDEPPAAARALDQAILLGPGTLVEEAALRRRIGVATDLNDPLRFLTASDEYVRRFLRSPYASQFADAFVSGIVALHKKLDGDRVRATIALMDPEQQKVIYLRIARLAAIAGLADLSAFASANAVAEGGSDITTDDPRAQLYSSLVNITSATRDDMLPRLRAIDRSRLSANDALLLDAAMAVVSELNADPPAPQHVPASPSEAADAATVPPPATPVQAEAESADAVEAQMPEEAPAPKDAQAPGNIANVEEPTTAGGEAAPQEEPPHDVASAGQAPGDRAHAAAPAPATSADDPIASAVSDARAKLEAIDKLLGEPDS